MIKTDATAQNTWITHPLQTREWGEFRSAMGIDVAQLKWQGPEPSKGQLTFHHIPYTPWTIGYFPKGPSPSKDMIHTLKALGKKKNAIFIQLEPNVLASPKTIQQCTQLPLIPSHHPLFTKYTFVLDLNKSEDELLSSMHPKTRYNLRVATKHGVAVREDNSPEAFGEYLRLNQETTGRQGFFAHNATYHRTMWKIMHGRGIAHLFTATYKGQTLAAWIIFAWQKTLYYPYGTSSREHREVMAPTRILWEIIRWGKTHGYTSFDLWGALGSHPDPHDPWFGFHRFKQGFNPTLIEFVGSYDFVLRPMLYRVYTVADNLRWALLKLRAH